MAILIILFNVNLPFRMGMVQPPPTQLQKLSTHPLTSQLSRRRFLTPISPTMLAQSTSLNAHESSNQLLHPRTPKLIQPNCFARKPTGLNTFCSTRPQTLDQWNTTTCTKVPVGSTVGVLSLAACEVAPNTALERPLSQIKFQP